MKTFQEFILECELLDEARRSARRASSPAINTPTTRMNRRERSTAAIVRRAGIRGAGKLSTHDLKKSYKTYTSRPKDFDPFGQSTAQDVNISTYPSVRKAAQLEFIGKEKRKPGTFATEHQKSNESVRRVRNFRRQLTRVGANQRGKVHTSSIEPRGNFDKGEKTKQMERGRNFFKASENVPSHLRSAGAKKGEGVFFQPAAVMSGEDRKKGESLRARIYSKIGRKTKRRITDLSPHTGVMVTKA
jgi:hypothetical protein